VVPSRSHICCNIKAHFKAVSANRRMQKKKLSVTKKPQKEKWYANAFRLECLGGLSAGGGGKKLISSVFFAKLILRRSYER
jgi:hypothetical protein